MYIPNSSFNGSNDTFIDALSSALNRFVMACIGAGRTVGIISGSRPMSSGAGGGKEEEAVALLLCTTWRLCGGGVRGSVGVMPPKVRPMKHRR